MKQSKASSNGFFIFPVEHLAYILLNFPLASPSIFIPFNLRYTYSNIPPFHFNMAISCTFDRITHAAETNIGMIQETHTRDLQKTK